MKPTNIKQALKNGPLILSLRLTPTPVDCAQLTTREQEVLELIVKGFISQQIADMLFVCLDTIESHRKNIIRKFKAKNVAEAVAYAFRNKLVK